MLMHHFLESAKSRLKPESHWLVNVTFLLTESFCKNYLFSVTSLWCTFVNPFLALHPTRILVHPRVHRAHRLKSVEFYSTQLFALGYQLSLIGFKVELDR